MRALSRVAAWPLGLIKCREHRAAAAQAAPADCMQKVPVCWAFFRMQLATT